jgi:lipoprotein NlpI
MRALALFCLTLLLHGAAGAQGRKSDWLNCNNSDPDLNIPSCTAIIRSGAETNQNLASAFSNRCAGYASKGDLDRALGDCTQAIRLNPDLAPAYVNRGSLESAKADYDHALHDYNQAIWLKPGLAKAYFGRASTYSRSGDYDHALDDYNRGISIDPSFAEAYSGRAYAYEVKGEHERAIQDYDQAIHMNPESASFRRNRGRVRFYSGKFDLAGEDFRDSMRLAPEYAYAPIWLYLAQSRAGEDGTHELEKNAARIDLSKWPAPIVMLFRGKVKPEDVLSAANNTDSKIDREQHCEAYFYLGEYALFHHDEAEATRLFHSTLGTGVTSFIEYAGARIELKRLEASAK